MTTGRCDRARLPQPVECQTVARSLGVTSLSIRDRHQPPLSALSSSEFAAATVSLAAA